MDILILLIPMSVVLVLLVGAAFWWSVKSGQFDDLEGPAHRILADDDTSDAIPAAKAGGPDVDTISTECALTTVNPKRGRDR
jgi:cbb3-type cytochrome oxidase maturation protein